MIVDMLSPLSCREGQSTLLTVLMMIDEKMFLSSWPLIVRVRIYAEIDVSHGTCLHVRHVTVLVHPQLLSQEETINRAQHLVGACMNLITTSCASTGYVHFVR